MEDKIYKVWHTLEKNGENIGHHITDLQFDGGVPYAVFEWLNTYEGEVPSIRVPLDPKWLQTCSAKGYDYVYGRPIVWPVCIFVCVLYQALLIFL